MNCFNKISIEPVKLYLNISLFLVLVSTSGVNAQIHKFTQVFNQPMILNPAYTGNIEYSRIIVNTSRRWPGFSQGKQARFDTYSISVDQFFPQQGIAGGILLGHDRSGSANLIETNLGLYAVKEFNGDNWIFRFGVEADYSTLKIDFSNLIFEDQIITGNSTSQESLVGTTGDVGFFDFSFGALFSSRKAWIGMAFHHLNQPDISLVDEKTILPTKITVHGGIRLAAIGKSTFSITSIYQTQSNIDQLSLGVSMKYQVGNKPSKVAPMEVSSFDVGIRYNGISFSEKLTINSGRVDPFAFSMGIKFLNFPMSSITYSYELPLFSTLSTSTGGAHEISLRFQTKGTIIPCPSDRNSWNRRRNFPIMDTR
jgi:type IX secretion system PorP/SprF family membrane protein